MYDPQRPAPPAGRPQVPPPPPVRGAWPVVPPPQAGFPPPHGAPWAAWGPVPPYGPVPVYGPPRPAPARRWPWVALIVALSVGVGVLGAQLYAAGTLASGVGPVLGGLVGEAPSSSGTTSSGSSGGSAPTVPDVHVGVANSASSSSAAGASSSSSATGGSGGSRRSHPGTPGCPTHHCDDQGGGSITQQRPLKPRIHLTLRCDLIDVTVCRGRGYTVSYDSVVTDDAGRPIYDRCFDHARVTNAKGVEIWSDSFACNTANPIWVANNQVLPDGAYTITERVELQDGGTATETLRFSVRS